jgi:hypothetical protein|tara:strand:+ start:912 stop:1448 length:537 start_codon:yes stop_codon:yes gene_type:complete
MSWDYKPCTGLGGGGTASTTKFCMVNSSTGEQQEVISTADGANGLIYYTKDTTDPPPGTAWTQQGFTRNSQGDIYSTGGVVRQINNPKPYAGTPVTSADPQDFQYLTDSAPGAVAFRKMNSFVGGWWMNIFGLRQEGAPIGQVSNRTNFSSEGVSKATKLGFSALAGAGLFAYLSRRQ